MSKPRNAHRTSWPNGLNGMVRRLLLPLSASLTVTRTENFQHVADLEPTTHHLII
jgi:hypothetical protein